jgi:hypothetical protein
VAQVHISSDPPRSKSWAEFRSGRDPPCEESVLSFFAASAFTPREWWWNLTIGRARRVPNLISDLYLDELRLRWPLKDPTFPRLLKVRADARRRQEKPTASTSSHWPEKVDAAEVYPIDW